MKPLEKIKKSIELIDLLKKEVDYQKFINATLRITNSAFDSNITAFFHRNNISESFKVIATFTSQPSEIEVINDNINRWLLPNGLIDQTITEKISKFKKSDTSVSTRKNSLSWKNYITEISIPITSIPSTDPSCEILDIIISSRFNNDKLTEEDDLFIKIISQMVGIFIHGYFFRNVLIKQHEQFEMIADSRLEDIDLIYERFLTNISNLLPSKFITLWLYNELDDTLTLRSFYPSELKNKQISFSSFDNRIIECSASLSGQVMMAGQPKCFFNLKKLKDNANKSFSIKYDLEWMICFPIISYNKQRKAGVINVFPINKPPQEHDPIISRIYRYVSEIASVIRLSTLFFEESLLYSHDKFLQIMLESQDQKTTWDKLAYLVMVQMHCEACSIFLLENDESLGLYGTTGLENEKPYSQVKYFKNDLSLTRTAFSQEDPLIYYSEFKEKYIGIHRSKFREKLKTPGRSKSILFVRILGENNLPIGVIRCNNKEENPGRHVGKFTKEDVIQLQNISRILSNIHIKFQSMQEKEKDRERNVNSLHHEILSPIDGILSHIEWMEKFYITENSEIQSRVKIKFEDIKQNSKLIEMLVTTMGRFDETIPLTRSLFSLQSTIQICKSFLFNEASRRNIDIKIGYFGLNNVHLDQLHMMRVFYNLIRNAIKYTDKEESKKVLQISGNATNDFIEILFSDNGIGIIDGEENFIFGKFNRGSNAMKVFPEGTGLGLAYCRMIIQKHGGDINLIHKSKPTTFQLLIPTLTLIL